MESHISSQFEEILIEKLLQFKDEIKEEFDKFRARQKENMADLLSKLDSLMDVMHDRPRGKAYNILVVGACESEDKAYKVFEEMSHPISIVTTETQGDEDVADKDGDDVLGISGFADDNFQSNMKPNEPLLNTLNPWSKSESKNADVEGNLIHEAQKDDQSKGDKLESTKIIYPMAAQGAWLPLIHLQPVLSSEGEGTVNVSATGSPKAWIGESTPGLKIVLGKNVTEIDALKVLDKLTEPIHDKLTEPIQTEESNGGQFISDLPIYVNGNDSYEQLRLDGDAHKVFDQFSPSFRAVRLDEQTYINGIKGAWERFLFDPGGRFLPQMCCDLLELNGEHEDYCLEIAASVVDKITAIKNVSESKVIKEIDEGHTMEKQQDESRVASAEDQGEKHATAVVAGGSEQGLSFMEKFDKIGRCTLLVCTSPPHSESNVCGLYIKLSSVHSNEEIYGDNDFLSSFSHILGLNNVDKINWQNDGFYNSFAYEEIVMRYSLAKVYMVDLCFHQCNVYGKYALNLSRGILHPVIRKAHGTCINKVVSSLRHALSTILPGDKHCLMASNHFHIYCSGSHLILALIFDRITHGKDSAVMVLITLSERANSELLMVILPFDPGGFCWPQMGSDPFEGNGEKGEFGLILIVVTTLVKAIKHKCRNLNVSVSGVIVLYPRKLDEVVVGGSMNLSLNGSCVYLADKLLGFKVFCKRNIVRSSYGKRFNLSSMAVIILELVVRSQNRILVMALFEGGFERMYGDMDSFGGNSDVKSTRECGSEGLLYAFAILFVSLSLFWVLMRLISSGGNARDTRHLSSWNSALNPV